MNVHVAAQEGRTRQVVRSRATRAVCALELFAGLERGLLASLAALIKPRRVTRGGTIFRQGDRGVALFLIERGSVRDHMVTECGRDLTVAVLGPGEMLGELAFLDGGEHITTTTALAEARFWELSRDDFYWFMRRHPAAAETIMARFAARFRRTFRDELYTNALGTTETRLAYRLASLARLHGRRCAAGILIASRPTQSQLGELIGRHRVTVNQTLRRFEKKGLIERQGRSIVVLAPERLERLAGTRAAA